MIDNPDAEPVMPCAATKTAIIVYGKRLGTKLTVCIDKNCPVHDPQAAAEAAANPAPTTAPAPEAETAKEAAERQREFEQLRVFLRALVNLDPYTLTDDVAEHFAGDNENNQQTDWAFRQPASSALMKCFRQFGCAEHVRHAFDVVCHRCQADLDPCTRQPSHQQARVSEDAVI